MELQSYALDFESRPNMIEFGTLDAVDLAAATSVIPDIFSETTADPIDNAFPEHSGVPEPREQRNGIVNPAPRTRKAKAPTLHDSDWKPHKHRILELYNQQDMDTQSLQRIIFEEKGFYAEYFSSRRLRAVGDTTRLRQYETALKRWKLGKYIKHREMAAIVRKMQHRRLVEVDKGDLCFKVRNKPVGMDNIRRWMRTHDVASDDLYGQSPPASTPSDVYCRTISERSTPINSPTRAGPSPQPRLEERPAGSPPRMWLPVETGPILLPMTNRPSRVSMGQSGVSRTVKIANGDQSGRFHTNHAASSPQKALMWDCIDCSWASIDIMIGFLQDCAGPERLLQSITILLSELEKIQQLLHEVQTSGDATYDDRERSTKLLRKSRVTQYLLQKLELRALVALTSPKQTTIACANLILQGDLKSSKLHGRETVLPDPGSQGSPSQLGHRRARVVDNLRCRSAYCGMRDRLSRVPDFEPEGPRNCLPFL